MKLISKTKAIEAILNLPINDSHDKQIVIDALEEIPIINDQINYHDYEYSFATVNGKWLRANDKCYACSNCWTLSKECTNFCSHCGAYMINGGI